MVAGFERNTLETRVDETVRDNLALLVAVGTFRGLVDKAGPAVARVFREVLGDSVSHTAKHPIWPQAGRWGSCLPRQGEL